jgi:hypothetical protein
MLLQSPNHLAPVGRCLNFAAKEKIMAEHEVEIFVNGTKHKVPRGRYTYDQVYQIAFPGMQPVYDPNKPITYSSDHGHKEGSLRPGESIEIHERMVFNVVPTHKS